MKSLKRDLFERRLWPLAVAIVAAIVAVPFVLHGHRAKADITTPPASSGTPTTSSSTNHGSPTSSGRRTTPTSRTRDPFEAASVTKRTSTSSSSTTATPTETTSTSGGSSPSSSSGSSSPSSSAGTDIGAAAGGAASSSSSSETTTPVSTAPPTTTSAVTTPVTTSPGKTSHHDAAKSWDVYSVDLRIGAPGSPVAHRNVARLMPLPRERSPQVMYMGVDGHGRAAVFALGAGVEVRAVGGARSTGAFCHPSRVDCALAVIPAGKSVALLYVSASGTDRALVLRVSRIKSEITRSATVLKAAREHVSPLGLCDLKLGDPIGFFDLADDSVSVPSTGACRHRKLAVAFPGSLGAGSSERG